MSLVMFAKDEEGFTANPANLDPNTPRLQGAVKREQPVRCGRAAECRGEQTFGAFIYGSSSEFCECIGAGDENAKESV